MCRCVNRRKVCPEEHVKTDVSSFCVFSSGEIRMLSPHQMLLCCIGERVRAPLVTWTRPWR